MRRLSVARGGALASLCLASAGVLLAAPTAAAQGAPAAEAGGEIVVTGRQRAEQIQDVPLAITAFNESFIETAVSTTVTDFQKYTPNVVFSDVNFSGNALAASIRGLSFADLEKTFEPAVGTSIDGVFLATNTGAAFDVFDVESIEILRGPQGTLAGRNTVGGAISVRRTRPTGEWGVRLGTRFGRYNQQDYQLVVNTPAVANDQLAAKLFAFYRSSDLFAQNLQRPQDEDDGLAVFQGGVTVSYDHAPGGFSALATLEVITDRSGFVPPVNLTRSFIEDGHPGPTFCDLGVILFSSTAGCGFASIQAAEDTGLETYSSPIDFENYIDGAAFTGEINWDLSEKVGLTAITGWRDSDERLREENTGSPGFFGGAVPLFVAARVQEFSQFSQEVRLDWEPHDGLAVITGLYYLTSDYEIQPGNVDFSPVRAQVFAFGGPAQIFSAGQELSSYAGFAEAVIGFNDTLNLTVGARYTYEEKDFLLNSSFQGNLPGTTTPDPAGIFNFEGTESWDSLTGRIILDWQPSDNLLFYGGWSRGFRSGGWNGRATRLTAVGPYDPETVDSYEIGMRADFFDRRLRFNPTLFYAKYDDQQAEIIRPAVGQGGTETVVENAASATIQGIELEVQARVTDNFTLRGAFGALDAEYDEFFVRDPVSGLRVDVASQRQIRRAPEFTASVIADYIVPLNDTGELALNGSYSWADDFATNLVLDPFGNRDTIEARGQADFSATYRQESPSGQTYRITTFIKDAFADDDVRIAATLDAGVFYFAVPVATKTYGVELAVDF